MDQGQNPVGRARGRGRGTLYQHPVPFHAKDSHVVSTKECHPLKFG